MATVPIALTEVKSSRLSAVGYHEDTFTMAIRFPATKDAPRGKVYAYENVSPEQYYDLTSAKSIGTYFGNNILNNPNHPFSLVDDGKEEVGVPSGQVFEPSVAVPEPVVIPDDKEEIKALALSTRSDATAQSITTAAECEAASREVLAVRARRKAAIAKLDAIKTPLRQAWQAVQDLWNEVDGAFAEAESYLDNGILEYRRLERQRVAEAEAAERRRVEAENAERIRQAQEEQQRLQAIENERAAAEAKRLADIDAAAAEVQGAPAEMVEQIKANPLPVQAKTITVTAPALISHATIQRQELPKVQGLGFKLEWYYTVEDEAAVPMEYKFVTLNAKKIDAEVQAMKKQTSIPGIRVDSREVPIKSPGRRK